MPPDDLPSGYENYVIILAASARNNFISRVLSHGCRLLVSKIYHLFPIKPLRVTFKALFCKDVVHVLMPLRTCFDAMQTSQANIGTVGTCWWWKRVRHRICRWSVLLQVLCEHRPHVQETRVARIPESDFSEWHRRMSEVNIMALYQIGARLNKMWWISHKYTLTARSVAARLKPSLGACLSAIFRAIARSWERKYFSSGPIWREQNDT